MKIIKYEKQKNSKYKLYLNNGETISLYEDTILDNNLLYDKEIDIDKLLEDNKFYDLYNKCIKYLSIRIRSTKEIIDYLKKYNLSIDIIDMIIGKLNKNKLLDDEEFTRCFINDKIKFSTQGEFRIRQELKKHNIDDSIIDKYFSLLDRDIILDKINKLINKYIKGKNKYTKYELKNKVYLYLNNLGYKTEDINNCLNNFNF